VLGALEKGEKATAVSVSVGPNGDAAALWTVDAKGGDSVRAAIRRGKSRFGRAAAVSPDVKGAGFSDPQIRVGADGRALAVWGALIDGRPSINATTFTGKI
jgi:hypothetical protein